jgi:LysM repeat protein
MTRKPVILLAFSLLLAMLIGLWPMNTLAQPADRPAPQNGYDVLAAVNSLRAANGLPAYNANSILMQIAQAQADYLAATGGSVGHTGPGGTTPKERAIAAGYPAVFFSENWQSGNGMSPSGAVSAWQGDAPHLNTMLSASLVDAGAGVSKSGSTVYYVLDAGASGSSSVAPTVTPGGPTVTPVTPGTAIVSQFMVPVTVNTPGPDGFVYHEVAYGQSLWSIAIAYNTKIESIKQLNNLGDIEIYVGQKLLVLKGPTPAPPTATPLLTQTSIPDTATLPATEVLLSVPATSAVTVTSTAVSPVPGGQGGLNITAIAIILAALVFAALGTWVGTRKAV